MHIYAISAADRGQRLDKYIRRLLPDAPSSFIYRMLRRKNIVLNGKKAAGSEIIAMGDEVRMYLSDETIKAFGGTVHGTTRTDPAKDPERYGLTPQTTAKNTANSRQHAIGRVLDARQAARTLGRAYPELRIVYEDHDIAAAYKPAGLLSQRADPSDLTLNEWFLGTLLQRGEITEESLRMFTPSVQNRLDRGTEGLVLLSKTLQGSQMLSGLQRERLLHKYYIMIVLGRIGSAGSVEGWLAKDRTGNRVRLYEEEQPGTVYSRTVYRPVAWAASDAAGDAHTLTGVEAELVTGRSHQLRAHMAWIGHPVLGDAKYGDPARNQAYRRLGVTSQLLMCQRVVFPKLDGDFSYLSGKRIEVPLPRLYLSIMRR